MSSTHYQNGTVCRAKRAKGPDVWVFRYRETDENGKRVARKRVIGDLTRYPTKASATRAVENTRAEINAREQRLDRSTVNDVWGHFQAHELYDPDVARSPTTIASYLVNFKAHIIPRWGKCFLEEVRAPEVEVASLD